MNKKWVVICFGYYGSTEIHVPVDNAENIEPGEQINRRSLPMNDHQIIHHNLLWEAVIYTMQS